MTDTVVATRKRVWVVALMVLVIAPLLLLRSTPKEKDTTLTNHAIIEAVQRGDWDVINAVPPEPQRLARDFEQVSAQLSDEGSQLATILARKYPSAETARFLLTMAQSTHMQAAVEAASAIDSLPQAPKAADIAIAASHAQSPLTRAQLYLALGRSHDADALVQLQQRLTQESDSDAFAKGNAAAARLGGPAERARFLLRVTNATSTNAKDVYDELLYIGDIRFAKGMLPWLDNSEPVTRIGSEADNRSARMCDLAVWTASRLGIKVPAREDKLDVYDASVFHATRVALMEIPNP